MPPRLPAPPAGGFYRPGSYLLAKMVLDALLLRVIPVFIFSAAFYPMVRWVCWERLGRAGLRLRPCLLKACREGRTAFPWRAALPKRG